MATTVKSRSGHLEYLGEAFGGADSVGHGSGRLTDGVARPRPSTARQRRRRPGRGPRWRISAPRNGGSAVVQQYTAGATSTRPLATRRVREVRVPRTRPVRLTARGRVVVLGVLLAVIVSAFWLGRATSTASADPVAASSVVVQPGQTLWEIAGDVAPGKSRRDTVAALLRLNPGLSGAVSPGQTVNVP